MDWKRARPLLEQLLSLPEERRAATLESLCTGDEGLRRKLAGLLAAGRERVGLFEPPSFPAPDEPDEPGAPGAPGAHSAAQDDDALLVAGHVVGTWRLIRLLGAGGMGAVWLAERDGGDFCQQVALKVVKRGLDTDQLLGRFRHERRLLAALDHPGVPRLIDGGATADGRPYLVMELVIGRPIDEVARGLDLRAKLRLFLALCEIVQHAHEHAIVHRDLKPSNVLVTEDGRVKVLDFGIAKLLEPSDGLSNLDLTLTGQQLLTPRYASPEQVRGGRVTAATDVHALGLLLWELLTGRAALEIDTLTRRDYEQLVCERSLAPPSRAAASGGTDSRALLGDLDTICAMATRKEPERRYASARQLADDVRLHLEGRPVLARPDTLVYRSAKFVRRHRALVLGGLGTILALCLGLVASLVQYGRARDASEKSAWTAYVASLDASEAALREGRSAPARQRLADAPQALRGWEWQHLADRLDRQLWSWSENPYMGRLAWSPDGRLLACADCYQLVICEGTQERLRVQNSAYAVSWSRDGQLAWCTTRGSVSAVDAQGWIAGNAEPRELLSALDTVWGARLGLDVAWSPSGEWLAISRADGSVTVVEPDGALVARFQAHEPAEDCGRLRWHPDGRRLASAGWDETVQLYDVLEKRVLAGWRAHTMGISDLDFDAEGERLVTTSFDRTVKLWDVASGGELGLLRCEPVRATCVRFVSEDLLTSDDNGALRLRDLASERADQGLIVHDGSVTDIAVHTASGLVATSGLSYPNGVRVWDLAARSVHTRQLCEFTTTVRASPDGQRFATAAPDRRIRIGRLPDLAIERELELDRGWALDVAWHPSEALLASAHAGGAVALWNPSTGELTDILEHGDTTTAVAFTPDGSQVVAICHDPPGSVYRVRSWSRAGELLATSRPIQSGATVSRWDLVADGDLVTAAGVYGLALGAHVADLEPLDVEPLVGVVDGIENPLTCLAVDPTTARTLYAGFSGGVLHWNPGAARPRYVLRPGIAEVRALSVHPDGSRLAVGTGDNIELYDTLRGERVLTLHGHAGPVAGLDWTPDGLTLLSVDTSGKLCAWQTR